MTAFELKDELAKHIKSIYIIEGEDYFLKSMALEQIKAIVPENNLKYCYDLFENDCDIGEILEIANTPTFFGGYRIIVAQGISKQASMLEIEKLKEYAQNPNSNAILVFFDCGAYINCIRDIACEIDCKKANEYQLSQYISSRFENEHFQIKPDAIKLLISSTSADMGKLTEETNKIFLFYMNETKNIISAKDIEDIISYDGETKIFELTNALQKKQYANALEIFYLLQKRGEKPNFIFATMVTAYRKYFHIALSNSDDSTLSKVLSMSPSALAVNKKIIENAKKTTVGFVPKLKKTIDYLYDLEYKFKSGQLSCESALELSMSWLISQ